MKQAEKFYLISDAAKQVQVESHVLRYWEEELKLPIKRNELGHRYYTEEDIERFRQIRDLKGQGLQLKAIRNVLQGQAGTGIAMMQSNPHSEKLQEEPRRHVLMVNKGEFVPITEESREAKSLRLQQLLQNMIVEAVRSNNREVCDEIKESLLKELDYQFRVQEEREEEREEARTNRQEEHYRQIDELLRARVRRRNFVLRKEREETEDAETDGQSLKPLQKKEKIAETAKDREETPKASQAAEAGEQMRPAASRTEKKEKFGFFQKKKRSVG